MNTFTNEFDIQEHKLKSTKEWLNVLIKSVKNK